MVISNPNRPICPDCGEELIYLCTNSGPQQLNCFVCDCRNAFLAKEIIECREDVSPDASIAMVTESYEEEEAIPPIPPDKAHFVLEFYCPN
jgi:hypothetical protein